MASILFLDERQVAQVLSIDDARECVRNALVAQAQGKVAMPLRTVAAGTNGLLGSMPAAINAQPEALGAKLVAVFPANADVGIATHQALIALFDPRCGLPIAVMDGRYITEVRTAATSALATAALAKAGAQTLAILGTGVQARAHVEALARVMNIDEVRVWGRSSAKAKELEDFARERGLSARVAVTPALACRGADVICTVTHAREPIIDAHDVALGTHINAVGFGGPTARELAGKLVAQARLVIDSLDGARAESGNIIVAQREGSLPANVEFTLLCDILAGQAAGRRTQEEITIFDSLGIGIEDIACARHAYERASAEGIGTVVRS